MDPQDRTQSIVDQIDQLVNDSIRRGDNPGSVEKCIRCGGLWHGQPSAVCPGPYGGGEVSLKAPSFSPRATMQASWEGLFFAAYCDHCRIQLWWDDLEDRDQWMLLHQETHPGHCTYSGCCTGSPVNN